MEEKKVIEFVNWLIQNCWSFRYGFIEDENLIKQSTIDFEYERNYADMLYDQAIVYPDEMRISGYINDIGWGYTRAENFDMTFDEFKIFWEAR